MLPGSPLPMWYQIAVILRGRILKGAYESERPFPSEAALCREFGLSRVTIRQALDVLVRQGLVRKRKGALSEVAVSVEPAVQMFTGYLEDVLTMFTATQVTAVDQDSQVPPPAVAAFLQVLPAEPVVHIRRNRVRDGRPFAVADSFLPPALGSRLEADDLPVYPILELLEFRLGVRAAEALQSIGAEAADPEIARCLDVAPGSPVLFVELRYLSEAGNPVAVSHIRLRHDQFRYQARLVSLRSQPRRRPGRPARATLSPPREGGSSE